MKRYGCCAGDERMTVGECGSWKRMTKLAYGEGAYEPADPRQDRVVVSGARRSGARSPAAPAHRQALARFGMLLGMAFQITDDLLDYRSRRRDRQPSGLDLREHKVTLPLIVALARMTDGRAAPRRGADGGRPSE